MTASNMRITRIDLEGGFEGRNHATISRKRGSDWIEVTILTPELTEGHTHEVRADCEEDLWSMAECLQHHLDGRRNTKTTIHDYYRQLQAFAD